jgi:hypothetical protein
LVLPFLMLQGIFRRAEAAIGGAEQRHPLRGPSVGTCAGWGYCAARTDRTVACRGYRRWDVELGRPPADPYAFAWCSPFHLVAGSYLAAVGRVASAALLCQTYGEPVRAW